MVPPVLSARMPSPVPGAPRPELPVTAWVVMVIAPALLWASMPLRPAVTLPLSVMVMAPEPVVWAKTPLPKSPAIVPAAPLTAAVVMAMVPLPPPVLVASTASATVPVTVPVRSTLIAPLVPVVGADAGGACDRVGRAGVGLHRHIAADRGGVDADAARRRSSGGAVNGALMVTRVAPPPVEVALMPPSPVTAPSVVTVAPPVPACALTPKPVVAATVDLACTLIEPVLPTANSVALMPPVMPETAPSAVMVIAAPLAR